ncbi:hypothetical protein L9F63_016398 [Diploptera punctata]|uniref:Peptidase S1 domain-containing protein n=1 Tax=Diploptera punctata TaxID=6984 RepID=A0AAD8A244_DIPPU|nr:hypothetical protein L9F63_016398 [Diploptera punctata]
MCIMHSLHSHIAFLLSIICGEIIGDIQPIPSVNVRIVGGEISDIRDIPYQVSLSYNRFHRCGAVIIDRSWCLTAAHCLLNKNELLEESLMVLKAGTNELYSKGIEHQISKMIVHPQYDSRSFDYDIALIKVMQPFNFTDKVNAVELPAQNWHPHSNTIATVSGWGKIKYSTKEISNVLRKVEVHILSPGVCNEKYPSFTPRMLCAGDLENDKGSCQGDSGGPLVSCGKLLGIVSWSVDCGMKEFPAGYTKVSKMRDWIRRETDI